MTWKKVEKPNVKILRKAANRFTENSYFMGPLCHAWTKWLPRIKRLISQKKTVGFLASCLYHFHKKSTKLNTSFSTFAPCFLIFCKSTLTRSFLLKIITNIILARDYKISEQENIITQQQRKPCFHDWSWLPMVVSCWCFYIPYSWSRM